MVNSATFTATIGHLCSIFSTHGLPELAVTDNGTVFTTAEFENFVERNNIQFCRTVPFHPS